MTTPLLSLIAERIAHTGPLSVADYMALALGHPEHGYYRTRDPLGQGGDFITAPEISQMFGELIGAWCAVMWRQMGSPSPLVLAELGPGRGTLMADALRALRAIMPDFTDAAQIHLVETSPVLRHKQAQSLAPIQPVWHDHWEELPRNMPLLLIANEFLDALPIRQFVFRQDGWRERMIGLDGNKLCFQDGPPATPEGAPLAAENAIFEVNEAAQSLARFLGDRIAAGGGAALFIDYGHARSAAGDSLQAVRRHATRPVLDDPGSSDITAHVDFEAFARAARPARGWGPVPQGTFLTRLGILERSAILERAHPDSALDTASRCRRLIEPAEMGTLFKVLALTDASSPSPPGFDGCK